MHPIERAAVEALAEVGRPVHIGEIRRLLDEKGITIPGRGTDANVIVYLSKSDAIRRVGKGIYALTAWGLPAVPPRRRRVSHRRRRPASPKRV
jgi:hypothetical protein